MVSAIHDDAGRRWALRRATGDDSPRLYAWRNDPAIRAVMANDAPIEPEEHRRCFARVSAASDALVTLFTLDDEPLGMMQLGGIDPRQRSARWGFYLRPDGAPPGSGSRMGYLILAHAFEELALHRVWADVAASNAASLAMHRKLGFRDEGVQRDAARRGDGWEDLVLFGLLDTEFRALAPDLRKRLFS